MIVGLAAVFGWWLKGWRLGLLAGGCIFYLALFGKWKLSMTTLSVVLVAAPIAAFIGTRDLGQEIFRALTFADAGKGLVIGLCVAFMGLAADQLITQWAARRKKELGLA